jgi:hypothetical protein
MRKFFSTFTEMACDKNQTSLGEFGKLPATLGASNPGLTSLQVCLLCNYEIISYVILNFFSPHIFVQSLSKPWKFLIYFRTQRDSIL